MAAAVGLTYANALGASFQFDDWNVVVRDPRVQSLGAWWQGMPGIRPLLKLSYAANHAAGLGVAGFHAVNVVIHAANAVLVLLLLKHLARRDGLAGPRAALGALAAAAIFALHPVQTEAVTYVSGRSSSLAALFSLASLLAWIEGRESGRAWLSWGISPALFALALGVKETAVVVPAAIALVWATDTRTPFRLRGLIGAIAPHLVVLLAALGAILASPTYRRLLATSLALRPPAANLLAQVRAVTYLGGQLVRPDRLNADPLLPVAAAWTPGLALEAAAWLGLFAGGLLILRSRPALAFGVLWFGIWLAPTQSLIARLDLANDRQLYLALLGPAWLVGRGLARWPLGPRAAIAAATVLALLLGAATVWRNRVYRDEIGFWEDVVRKTPENPRALNNLGYAYALVCRQDEAEAALILAHDLAPADSKIAVNLGLLRQGALFLPAERSCGGVPGLLGQSP